MTEGMPHGELLQKAIQWINDERQDAPQKKLSALLDEAGMRFNLTPKDCMFLQNIFPTKEKPD